MDFPNSPLKKKKKKGIYKEIHSKELTGKYADKN